MFAAKQENFRFSDGSFSNLQDVLPCNEYVVKQNPNVPRNKRKLTKNLLSRFWTQYIGNWMSNGIGLENAHEQEKSIFYSRNGYAELWSCVKIPVYLHIRNSRKKLSIYRNNRTSINRSTYCFNYLIVVLKSVILQFFLAKNAIFGTVSLF